jgi:hypothetical protein
MTGFDVWLNQFPGFIVGAMLGTALGWAANARRETRRIGDRVDRLENPWDRGETGSVRARVGNLALLVVVGLTVYSSVVSQIASNKVTVDARNRGQEIACTSHVLFQLSSAIDTRTQFSGAQAQANIALQQSQLDLLNPNDDGSPVTPEQAAARLETYLKALNAFLALVTTSAETNAVTPYPDPDKYAECLKKARE